MPFLYQDMIIKIRGDTFENTNNINNTLINTTFMKVYKRLVSYGFKITKMGVSNNNNMMK